jgi:hypothetical protein
MRRVEVDELARRGGLQFRRRIFFDQLFQLSFQTGSFPMLKLFALSRQPMIKCERDPVEIIEKPLNMGRRSKGIDPAQISIKADRSPIDLDQTWNSAIDEAVQLRQGVAQAHSRLRII